MNNPTDFDFVDLSDFQVFDDPAAPDMLYKEMAEPCDNCGSDDIEISYVDGAGYQVVCKHCGEATDFFTGKDGIESLIDATEDWNNTRFGVPYNE